jgi:hypothetical protein
MKGLNRMCSSEQLDQFFSLWQHIQEVVLKETQDMISWTLTNDGQYSATFANEFQFKTRLPRSNLEQVWKIRAEPKVKFHCWLMLQGRIWTADRLQRRGLTNHDMCPLCDQEKETAAHIFVLCPFPREVWHASSTEFTQLATATSSSTSLSAWWDAIWNLNRSKELCCQASAAMYFVWNLWKEQNSPYL